MAWIEARLATTLSTEWDAFWHWLVEHDFPLRWISEQLPDVGLPRQSLYILMTSYEASGEIDMPILIQSDHPDAIEFKIRFC